MRNYPINLLIITLIACCSKLSLSQPDLPSTLEQSDQIPGDSLVTIAAALRSDTLRNLNTFASKKYDCSTLVVKDTQFIKNDGKIMLDSAGNLRSGYITEEWNVEVCGTERRLKFLFGPDGKDGNYIAIGELAE